MVVRSKAYLWGSMVAGIASSKPHEGVDVSFCIVLVVSSVGSGRPV